MSLKVVCTVDLNRIRRNEINYVASPVTISLNTMFNPEFNSEQFLLLPQCFQLYSIIVLSFEEITMFLPSWFRRRLWKGRWTYGNKINFLIIECRVNKTVTKRRNYSIISIVHVCNKGLQKWSCVVMAKCVCMFESLTCNGYLNKTSGATIVEYLKRCGKRVGLVRLCHMTRKTT